jgi:hypothetical protein
MLITILSKRTIKTNSIDENNQMKKTEQRIKKPEEDR